VTEILIDVDFGHPPERVWRALTDRSILSEWFMQTDLEPHEGRRFRLLPEGLLGLAGPLEGELVELAAPRRMVMLWRGEQLHSRVTWELVPLPDGCRLRMSHTGFIGVKGSLRRRELQRTYQRMLTERLPRVLDRLATGGVTFSRPAVPPLLAVPPLADDPLEPAPAGDGDRTRRRGPIAWLTALPHRRRGQILAAMAAAVLAVATFSVISSLGVPSFLPPIGAAPRDWPTGSPGLAGPSEAVPQPRPASPGPTGQAAGSGASASAVAAEPPPAVPGPRGAVTPSAGPAPAPEPTDEPPEPAPPPAVRWSASYRTIEASGNRFTGQLTVVNRRGVAASGWSVVVTLPAGADLTTVRRAGTATQAGDTVTFTARNPRMNVGARASVVVEFDVIGATAPLACRVDGRPCAGVSG
jgi:uncharacterized protein YndB with AHSA1/START domain